MHLIAPSIHQARSGLTSVPINLDNYQFYYQEQESQSGPLRKGFMDFHLGKSISLPNVLYKIYLTVFCYSRAFVI